MAEINTDIGAQTKGFFKITDLGVFIQNLIQVILALGSIIALFYLIWGGIDFITSAGNQEKVKSAKEKINSALIGITILAVVWILWRLALYFLGLSSSLEGPVNLKVPKP